MMRPKMLGGVSMAPNGEGGGSLPECVDDGDEVDSELGGHPVVDSLEDEKVEGNESAEEIEEAADTQ